MNSRMNYDYPRINRDGEHAKACDLIDMTQPVPVNEFNGAKKGQWVKVHWSDNRPDWGYITGNNYNHTHNDISREVFFSPPSDIQYQSRYVNANQVSKICEYVTIPESYLLGIRLSSTRLNKNCENCDHRFECFTGG